MVLGAGNDAADERDKQEDVDGTEPGRRVDVKQLELVHHRSDSRVLLEERGHAVGVGRPLRIDGAWNSRRGQQQQQQQGGAHGSQLAPGPAQPAHYTEDWLIGGCSRGDVIGRTSGCRGLRALGGSQLWPPGSMRLRGSIDRWPSGVPGLLEALHR